MNAQEKLEKILKLLEKGDYESARKSFHELANGSQEKNAKIDYTLGELVSLVGLGRTVEARELLHASPFVPRG